MTFFHFVWLSQFNWKIKTIFILKYPTPLTTVFMPSLTSLVTSRFKLFYVHLGCVQQPVLELMSLLLIFILFFVLLCTERQKFSCHKMIIYISVQMVSINLNKCIDWILKVARYTWLVMYFTNLIRLILNQFIFKDILASES